MISYCGLIFISIKLKKLSCLNSTCKFEAVSTEQVDGGKCELIKGSIPLPINPGKKDMVLCYIIRNIILVLVQVPGIRTSNCSNKATLGRSLNSFSRGLGPRKPNVD